eukprot:CAMPEP_0113935470 /NCGR_PEP_ID=MMETSP1339-20121228/2614_1 /TAXON_ID=94617 /ORGANISM="Fibrocapsa japonica" /LENGTH=233 /DNA_ID=CAMNT_0000937633 /DNA_START=260 /DNA_END=962 /DNA_ORIENTATION=- /assembly_acc=CAM_ASM_000762
MKNKIQTRLILAFVLFSAFTIQGFEINAGDDKLHSQTLDNARNNLDEAVRNSAGIGLMEKAESSTLENLLDEVDPNDDYGNFLMEMAHQDKLEIAAAELAFLITVMEGGILIATVMGMAGILIGAAMDITHGAAMGITLGAAMGITLGAAMDITQGATLGIDTTDGGSMGLDIMDLIITGVGIMDIGGAEEATMDLGEIMDGGDMEDVMGIHIVDHIMDHIMVDRIGEKKTKV